MGHEYTPHEYHDAFGSGEHIDYHDMPPAIAHHDQTHHDAPYYHDFDSHDFDHTYALGHDFGHGADIDHHDFGHLTHDSDLYTHGSHMYNDHDIFGLDGHGYHA